MAKKPKKKKKLAARDAHGHAVALRSTAAANPDFADPAKATQRDGHVGSGSMGEKPKPGSARRRKSS